MTQRFLEMKSLLTWYSRIRHHLLKVWEAISRINAMVTGYFIAGAKVGPDGELSFFFIGFIFLRPGFQPSRLFERTMKHPFELSIDAAEFIRRPFLDGLHRLGINS